ncbi:uncharacterized [Tachysurus ichikawai]
MACRLLCFLPEQQPSLLALVSCLNLVLEPSHSHRGPNPPCTERHGELCQESFPTVPERLTLRSRVLSVFRQSLIIEELGEDPGNFGLPNGDEVLVQWSTLDKWTVRPAPLLPSSPQLVWRMRLALSALPLA